MSYQLLLLLISFVWAEEPASKEFSRVLSSSGFVCQMAYHCRGMLESYPLPVNIIFSRYLSLDKSVDKPINLALHFHGHTNHPDQDPFHSENGNYAGFIEQSQANIILVIPESIGSNTTYREVFTKPLDAQSVFTEAKNIIQSHLQKLSYYGPLEFQYLSAHSGADQVTALLGEWTLRGFLPSLQSIKYLALFDSLYNKESLAGWKSWGQFLSQKGGVLFSAYNPSCNNTDCRKNRYIEVAQSFVFPARVIDRPAVIEHMDYMKEFMSEFYSSDRTFLR